jgi:hypothetical protein
LLGLALASQSAFSQCAYAAGVFSCSGNVGNVILLGDAADNTFTFADGTTGTITINSGGQVTRDRIVFTGWTAPVTLDATNQAGFQPVAPGLQIWLQGFAAIHIVGGSQGDTLTGTGGDDVIDGGPGADIIDGAGGNDTQPSADPAQCAADTVTNVEADACPYITMTGVGVPANATYLPGDALDFTVTYSASAIVTGIPRLPLAIGAANVDATYMSGGGTPTLTFRYVLQPGDADGDGIALGVAISLNGGTIRDAGGNDASTTLSGVPSTAGILVASPARAFTGPSATGSGSITASFASGGPACGFAVAQFIPVSGHPASPPASSSLPGVAFPHGLFDFTTSGCTPGGSITMTIIYPAMLPAGTQYYKYGPTASNPTPHWYVLPATIVGSTVSFTITDGGLGDDDLTANGTIVDQGGPGAPGADRQVPTLSPWAILLLGSLLLLAGMRRRLR